MDIVNVLNTIRLFKVFFTMKFPPEQRMLLKLQCSQVIKSGSEDDHDEVWDQDHEFLQNIYNEKDPIKAVLGLAYISRTFRSYWINNSRTVSKDDHKLLEGFYRIPIEENEDIVDVPKESPAQKRKNYKR